jgi:penicillin amidase
MKRIRTWLIRIGLALLILVVVVVSTGIVLVRRTWPEASGTLTAPGLSASVTIIRDRWGVPHIYAQNEHDLFFAQGYVHAQDRLWQMEIDRRISNGTLSEMLGSETIQSDRLIRTVGLRRMAEQTWATLDSEHRAILDAYSAGVNNYIDTHRDRLPLEFTLLGVNPAPMTPIDMLAWANLLAFHEDLNFKYELWLARFIAELGETRARQLLPTYADGAPLIIPPKTSGQAGDTSLVIPPGVGNYAWLQATRAEAPVGVAGWASGLSGGLNSNNWSISGSRTKSGKPILANDPHLPLALPFSLYENDLHGGRFNTAGFTFPGIPLVLFGHNQRIAWGITNTSADVEDAYIEKLDDAQNPTQYEFMGAWRKLEIIPETILVKGAEPVHFNVLRTRHGPIMNDTLRDGNWVEPLVAPAGQPIAMHWNLYEGSTNLTGLVALNLAANWDEFRAAVQHWDSISENFAYADVDGNIGYQMAGKIPIRAPGHQGTVPAPGWTDQYDWRGFIPFDQLPSMLNPQQGFVATANNRIVSDDYPYWLSNLWDVGYRAKRLNDLLSANSSATIEDMQRIQADSYSPPAEILRPYLAVVQPQNEVQAKALAAVNAWDLKCTTAAVGPSIYEAWFRFLLQDTIRDTYGDARADNMDDLTINKQTLMMIKAMADPNSPWFQGANRSRDDLVRRSFGEAVHSLSANYGSDPSGWEWGRLHTVTFTHIPFGLSGIAPLERFFNGQTIPVPGCSMSINLAGSWSAWPAVDFGVSMRSIMDLGDWDRSVAVVAPGESGLPFAPHREDQALLWKDVRYHPMLFSRKAVEQNAEDTLTLVAHK